jgi:tetratricopeptide (TPR) repeat protein
MQLSTCQKRRTKLQSSFMRIWKITAVVALAFNSFAADNVAPTKSELEEMYNKAFHEFEANNFPQALKELDAIDARQPDLAPSQNLRGVILMRQGVYDKAESALLEAARIDPKFWNARFNLAEVPFLQKNWAEARNRFQKLLSSSQSDLASEATQLIQYKILLTYLLEGKDNMVDSILAKLELSSDTPAVHYVKAAVALQHKNEKEAKDLMAVAEKNFSPQLNKLFVESFYEVGWLGRPSGEGRASMPLMTAGERKEKAKVTARAKFEQAQQALRQRDLPAARKLIDEADQAEPNQPATLNLRGEILMAQQEFDQAEVSFKKAAKLDPKFREAQYNLAQVPFKKKDYAKARERFEALFERTPGGDKNQAAELIKFKIYMTLLLEGKESRAQSMMDQFQFTGDTPALYYAQAAWEFKHNNGEKAGDWVASAKKIYSQPLNSIFADALYDAGWMQAPETASAPAFDAGSLVASQTESGGAPAIEPSPIPASVAASKQGETAKTESITSSGPAASPVTTGSEAMEAQPGVPSATESFASGTRGQPAQTSSPAEWAGAVASPAATAAASSVPSGKAGESAVIGTKPSPTAVSKGPATAIASAWRIAVTGFKVTSYRTWLVGGLLLVGIFLLAWVLVPGLSRRYAFTVSDTWQSKSFLTPPSLKPVAASPEKDAAAGNGFFGGPRQISARLTASRPSSRSGLYELVGSGGALHRAIEPHDGDSAGFKNRPNVPEAIGIRTATEKAPLAAPREEPSALPPVIAGVAATQAKEPTAEATMTEPLVQEQAMAQMPVPAEKLSEIPAVAEGAVTPVIEPPGEPQFESVDQSQPIAQAEKLSEIPAVIEGAVTPVIEPPAEAQFEAVDPAQPVAHQMPISATAPPAAEVAVVPPYSPNISNEPVSSQTTTSLTMPEQSEQLRPGEVPLATDAPRPASAAHTPVQLTFSFEIVSVQLTPTFKVRTLQLRPASKGVTMRLASSQRSQPQLHPHVAFEIAKIQPADSGLGKVRLIKSTRQRQELAQQPVDIALPAFEVTGVQPISSSDGVAGVQLAPSEQGKAHVQVTGDFQMANVEFSPSFEVTGVVLNPTSRQVSVRLAGADPGAVEEASVFDVANVRIADTADSETLELHAV